MKTTPQPPLAAYCADNQVLSLVAHAMPLNLEDRFNCLQLLQESLDIKDLLDVFAAQVAKMIRPFHLHLKTANGLFSLNEKKCFRFSNSFHLPLSSQLQRIATITYQSHIAMTANEKEQLNALHKLLLPSLRHALKFAELNARVFKDHLTGIGNRAYYDESLLRAIQQSERTQQPLALMLLDIDHFKQINDTFGHLKGDNVLQHFAALLSKSTRTSDMAFRLGGDEFAILLQPGDERSIQTVHKRLTMGIRRTAFLQEMNFSSSLGYALWRLGDTENSLFAAADKRLYQDKGIT